MYTIKHAAELVGISATTLRAWERRYGIVSPERTDGGYRVYSEEDVRVLRTMRELVDEGWSPSLAAREALKPSTEAPVLTLYAGDRSVPEEGSGQEGLLSEPFVNAAAALDAAAISSLLDEMFSAGGFENVVRLHLFPALKALGEAWAAGRVSVAGEHFASHAVMRRVAAAYEAAASVSHGPRVLLGMPPGRRHELGLFVFAVAARRRGLDTDYLGADLPIEDWLSACAEPGVAAVVLAVPTEADVEPTAQVVAAVRDLLPDLLIAAGGAQQDRAPEGVLRLGHDISTAAQTLSEAVARSRAARSADKR